MSKIHTKRLPPPVSICLHNVSEFPRLIVPYDILRLSKVYFILSFSPCNFQSVFSQTSISGRDARPAYISWSQADGVKNTC